MWGATKLEKRLRELEEAMLKLTRVVESHDLDWHDMRMRCKRLLDRTEKAAKRLEPEVESEVSADPEAAAATTESGNGRLALTPSQQRLQQQILRMRGGK